MTACISIHLFWVIPARWHSDAGNGKVLLAPGDRAIRLFGNAESIKAISLKLRALDREGAEIKNVLIILDRASLSHFELLTGPSNILPSAISGRNPFTVQLAFIQGFATPDFFVPIPEIPHNRKSRTENETNESLWKDT